MPILARHDDDTPAAARTPRGRRPRLRVGPDPGGARPDYGRADPVARRVDGGVLFEGDGIRLGLHRLDRARSRRRRRDRRGGPGRRRRGDLRPRGPRRRRRAAPERQRRHHRAASTARRGSGGTGSPSRRTAAAGARWSSGPRSPSSCSPTSRPGRSSPHPPPASPSGSAAAATGTTGSSGCATPPSASTPCCGSASPTRRSVHAMAVRTARPGLRDRRARAAARALRHRRQRAQGGERARPPARLPRLAPGAHRQRRGGAAPARHLRRADRLGLPVQQVRRRHQPRRLDRPDSGPRVADGQLGPAGRRHVGDPRRRRAATRPRG